MDATDAAVVTAEADATKPRHKRWDRLLAGADVGAGKKAQPRLTTSGTDVNIEPFVKSKYNQNQPWNDLTPVTGKDADYIWRGRSCAGCVSIADAALWNNAALKSGVIYGFAVGGMCRNASASGVEAAKGMTITGLAVFTNILTVAEMNDYLGPQEKTTATPYPVPYSWIATYVPGIPESFMDQFAKMGAVNGENKYWECYVLGLNPTNALDRFTTTIRMEGQTPIVEFSPTNEVLRASGAIRYILQGKPSLTNDWQDVEFADPGDTNRFFRVKVTWRCPA